MKRKLLSILAAASLAMSLAACGGTSSSAGPADLTGDWKQANSNSETSYQTATISGSTIEVYWYDAATETKALYWAGTYTAPTDATEPYTWESENDTEKTSTALMASGDATKTFTYEKGEITYDVSMMGVTQTVHLKRAE